MRRELRLPPPRSNWPPMPPIATVSRSGIRAGPALGSRTRNGLSRKGETSTWSASRPKAGELEFWINAETKLIERLVEREAEVTRTEFYSDHRDVQGVKIPFHVRTKRGDPKFDEIIVVQKITFGESLAGVAFGPPAEPQELAFPAGRAAVDVDFETYSGHLFVRVILDGHGPFRMLFDSGGANVLSAETAALLVGSGKQVGRTVQVGTTSLNGVELGGQHYVVADIDAFLRRVEGLDDVAGVMGLEWFVRMPVKIDYARSRITLYDPVQFKYSGGGARVPVAARAPAASTRQHRWQRVRA